MRYTKAECIERAGVETYYERCDASKGYLERYGDEDK
jgi:hypothetical protein